MADKRHVRSFHKPIIDAPDATAERNIVDNFFPIEFLFVPPAVPHQPNTVYVPQHLPVRVFGSAPKGRCVQKIF